LPDSQIAIVVRVTPRSGQNRIVGWASGQREQLVARVEAPPQDGLANAALIRLLAEALKIAKSRVSLVKGLRSHTKTISLQIDADQYQKWANSIPIIGEE